jgi:uncharacterized protein (DUF2267 family)
MDYDKLLKEIGEAGEFRHRAHARDAAEAVLSVLGEHLEGGSPGNLGSQLPVELAQALPPTGGGEAFGVDQFDLRVREREGRDISLEEAHEHAIALLTTVLRAVTPGEARAVAAQLPREYTDFLPADLR